MRKNATITVRVPRPTRRRLEALARREGRSLSQQVERLIEKGLAEHEATHAAESARPLAGRFPGKPVPKHADFRSVRTLLSAALRSSSTRGPTGR